MRKRHNKFLTLKGKELKLIKNMAKTTMQIHIIDEGKLLRDITEAGIMREFDQTKTPYANFKRLEGFEVVPFSTTMGDYDGDSFNWYLLIDKKANCLILVNREVL